MKPTINKKMKRKEGHFVGKSSLLIIIAFILISSFLALILINSSYNLTGLLVFNSTNSTDFSQGTYTNTYYNTTNNAVQITSGLNGGSYLSKIFDVGSNASWLNLSWFAVPSGMNLPNYQRTETGGIDMSSNVFLYHF